MRVVTAFLLAMLIALPASADDKIPAAEWDGLMTVYKQRASLTKHQEAAKKSVELARKYPKDRDLQLFCAMTAYYCAHRLLDKEKEKKKVAVAGLECAQRVVDANDKDYDGRYWASMTSFKSKSADGIRAALKEATRIKAYLEQMKKDEPKRFEAYMMLGTLYRELPSFLTWGDPKKGVELLEEAKKLAPKDPEVLLELAAAYAKVKRKDEARTTYNKCINDSKAPKHRAWETQDAIDYAKKMLKELDD